MRVKPAPGLSFRDPYTKHPYTDQEEIEVADGDLLYAKFLEHGDVVLVSGGPASAIAAGAGHVEDKKSKGAKP